MTTAAPFVAVVLLALYTPLTIAVGGVLQRLLKRSRRPLFLETGFVTMGLVALVAVALVHWGGQTDSLREFLFACWPQPYWYGIAVASGLVLYLGGARLSLPFLKRLFRLLGLNASEPLRRWPASEVLRSYLKPWLLATMPVVNFLEECLWRGLAIWALTTHGVGPWAACFVSSVFYGTYHYALGIHHAALNGAVGFFYGILALESGNILIPFCAHLAYNLATIPNVRRALAELELREAAGRAQGF